MLLKSSVCFLFDGNICQFRDRFYKFGFLIICWITHLNIASIALSSSSTVNDQIHQHHKDDSADVLDKSVSVPERPTGFIGKLTRI